MLLKNKIPHMLTCFIAIVSFSFSAYAGDLRTVGISAISAVAPPSSGGGGGLIDPVTGKIWNGKMKCKTVSGAITREQGSTTTPMSLAAYNAAGYAPRFAYELSMLVANTPVGWMIDQGVVHRWGGGPAVLTSPGGGIAHGSTTSDAGLSMLPWRRLSMWHYYWHPMARPGATTFPVGGPDYTVTACIRKSGNTIQTKITRSAIRWHYSFTSRASPSVVVPPPQWISLGPYALWKMGYSPGLKYGPSLLFDNCKPYGMTVSPSPAVPIRIRFKGSYRGPCLSTPVVSHWPSDAVIPGAKFAAVTTGWIGGFLNNLPRINGSTNGTGGMSWYDATVKFDLANPMRFKVGSTWFHL